MNHPGNAGRCFCHKGDYETDLQVIPGIHPRFAVHVNKLDGTMFCMKCGTGFGQLPGGNSPEDLACKWRRHMQDNHKHGSSTEKWSKGEDCIRQYMAGIEDEIGTEDLEARRQSLHQRMSQASLDCPCLPIEGLAIHMDQKCCVFCRTHVIAGDEKSLMNHIRQEHGLTAEEARSRAAAMGEAEVYVLTKAQRWSNVQKFPLFVVGNDETRHASPQGKKEQNDPMSRELQQLLRDQWVKGDSPRLAVSEESKSKDNVERAMQFDSVVPREVATRNSTLATGKAGKSGADNAEAVTSLHDTCQGLACKFLDDSEKVAMRSITARSFIMEDKAGASGVFNKVQGDSTRKTYSRVMGGLLAFSMLTLVDGVGINIEEQDKPVLQVDDPTIVFLATRLHRAIKDGGGERRQHGQSIPGSHGAGAAPHGPSTAPRHHHDIPDCEKHNSEWPTG